MTQAEISPLPEYDAAAMRRMPVDVEHLGIRMALPVLAIGAGVLIYVVVPFLLEAFGFQVSSTLTCILFLLSLAGAVGAAYMGDRLLKRVWPSRRDLLLDEHLVVLRRPGRPDEIIRRAAQFNILTWRFVVPRRGRIPRGHLCLGLQLNQDDRRISLYTFIPPKEGDSIDGFEAFTMLRKRKELDDPKMSLRLAGQQKRLLQAEAERWQDGAELLPEDFKTVWAEIRHEQTELA